MVHFASALKGIALAGVLGLGFVPGAVSEPSVPVVAQIDSELDIVDVAGSFNDFTTLVAAIRTAGLTDALRGDGPFTVFAPTNEAFQELDATLSAACGIGVADLLEPENRPLLQEVLQYHVVAGAEVAASDIPQGTTVLEALNEEDLRIDRIGDDVEVNGVDVTTTDVPAVNGVIHVVDEVLLPDAAIALVAGCADTEPIPGLW